jgi:hypothetical protein
VAVRFSEEKSWLTDRGRGQPMHLRHTDDHLISEPVFGHPETLGLDVASTEPQRAKRPG